MLLFHFLQQVLANIGTFANMTRIHMIFWNAFFVVPKFASIYISLCSLLLQRVLANIAIPVVVGTAPILVLHHLQQVLANIATFIFFCKKSYVLFTLLPCPLWPRFHLLQQVLRDIAMFFCSPYFFFFTSILFLQQVLANIDTFSSFATSPIRYWYIFGGRARFLFCNKC